MASTSGVAEAATRSLLMSIRRSFIHCGSMYVNNLRASAREHEVTGLLDLLPQRRVTRFLDAGRAVGVRGDGNEDVVLRPRDVAIALEQVIERDLELAGTVP